MTDIFDLFKKISRGSSEPAGKPEFIVAGLGNPGFEYEGTRHNAGFCALDYIASKCSCKVRDSKFKALTGIAVMNGKNVLLMKPQTYMNNSGEAVSAAASFYKISPQNVIVISDDVCQKPGKIRIRKSGSAGGQKGLKSIIEHLGTEDFPRIRIGVGEKPCPEYDLAAWVLGKVPDEDRKLMESRFDDVYDAIPMIMDGRFDDAMGSFNGK